MQPSLDKSTDILIEGKAHRFTESTFSLFLEGNNWNCLHNKDSVAALKSSLSDSVYQPEYAASFDQLQEGKNYVGIVRDSMHISHSLTATTLNELDRIAKNVGVETMQSLNRCVDQVTRRIDRCLNAAWQVLVIVVIVLIYTLLNLGLKG
jgi:hypothetical protein